MSGNKKMSLLLLFIAFVLFIIVFALGWHLFFGMPNPPLSQATVTVQSAATSATTASDTLATAAPASTDEASSSVVVDGENPPLPAESLSVDGAVFNVEIASTTLEQSRGLSFRPSLNANAGMLFIFSYGGTQTFWMKDMNFPLDMIWISGNTVVGFAQDAAMPTPGMQLWQLPIYTSPGNTDKVLEVDAGTVAKYGIKVGDAITIGPAQ